MDIELTRRCARDERRIYDHLVLFSGDGDFTALVAALQRKGKRVTVVSTLTTPTPMIADDLRRQADFFIDVADLAKTVGRAPPVDRTAGRADRRRLTAPWRPWTLRRPKSPSRRLPLPDTNPPHDCPLCPRLVGVSRTTTGGVSGLVQWPGAELGRRASGADHRRPRAGPARAPTAPAGRSPATMPATCSTPRSKSSGLPRATTSSGPTTA